MNHEIEIRSDKGSLREAGRIPKSHLIFFEIVSQLNQIERQGWLDRGIQNPESVGEHSYLAAVMTAFEAEKRGLDVAKAVKMILIHDWPELGPAGDRTPHQDLSGWQKEVAIFYQWTPPSEEALKEKREKEEIALRTIMRGLPLEFRSSIIELWQEYEEGQTEEAKLVHQMDVLQRLLQAKEYRMQEGESFPINPFIQEALASDDPELRRIARIIEKDIAFNIPINN